MLRELMISEIEANEKELDLQDLNNDLEKFTN